MPFLTKDALLNATHTRYREIKLADGNIARIRSLSEREKSAFEMDTLSKNGGVRKSKIEAGRRNLICLCLVDEQGNRTFADSDADKLRDVDGAITSQLYDECRKHCGFEESDIEDLVKNSEAIHVDDSPTD